MANEKHSKVTRPGCFKAKVMPPSHNDNTYNNENQLQYSSSSIPVFNH